MEEKQPQQLTFAEFAPLATIVKLKNHGRVAEVSFGGQSLGFVDAMGDRGLRQAHRRAVNNALYWYTEGASGDMPKPALPAAEALSEYPELVDKFSIARSILGFYVERSYCGAVTTRYCFPDDEERKTLRNVVDSYGFLVERNERISLLEFADRIAMRYDVAEPRTRVVIEALRSCAGVSKFACH